MPMNELSQMRIFGLLSETSQEVTNEKIQNAWFFVTFGGKICCNEIKSESDILLLTI